MINFESDKGLKAGIHFSQNIKGGKQMRRRTIRLIIVLGSLVIAGTSFAGSSELEHYYNDYISEKIYDCSRTASIFNACYNGRMTELTEMRAAQAKFYQKNRAELVKILLANDMGLRKFKIDYFLISRFKYAGNPEVFADRSFDQ
jgi:hypothetical protein